MAIVPVPRNIWWMAMWAGDLKPGDIVARRIMDEPLALFRTEDGRPAALYDRCAHRWAPLSHGKLVAGDLLQCPYHGLEYDRHGVCVRNPHPNYQIPSTMRVRSYPLAEKHSAIWIWMGTGRPDESLIPDFGWLDPGANPIDRRAYLHMPCAWDLMVDNLLDTSHVAILHDGVFGSSETLGAEFHVEQPRETRVTVSHGSENVTALPTARLLFFNRHARIDTHNTMTWDAPACLTNDGKLFPVGGTEEQATGFKSCHFLTPETETSCHYHIAAMRWQPISGSDEENAEIMRHLAESRRVAFEEQDGVIIAAQQARLLEAGGHFQPVPISTDSGVERAHKILRALHADKRREPVQPG